MKCPLIETMLLNGDLLIEEVASGCIYVTLIQFVRSIFIQRLQLIGGPSDTLNIIHYNSGDGQLILIHLNPIKAQALISDRVDLNSTALTRDDSCDFNPTPCTVPRVLKTKYKKGT